ncbi:hypothetical protein [Methylotuvimicrobium sp.]|uniref:hypothetical protein n=1 Tax=Methylotuvimicrobium sp. TaxID=2822413 RepID=UPI003D64DB47
MVTLHFMGRIKIVSGIRHPLAQSLLPRMRKNLRSGNTFMDQQRMYFPCCTPFSSRRVV